MPKEVITIESFRGAMQSADARDTPLQSASHLIDVDPSSKRGELRGRKDDLELVLTPINGEVFEAIEDGTKVISFDGTWINAITGVPNTASSTQIINPTTSGDGDISSDGRSARVALGNGSTHIPQWIGFIDHDQFDGEKTAPAGATNYAPAHLVSPTPISIKGGTVSITSASSGDETAFPTGYQYAYRVSYEYDGYQNGPMHDMGGVTVDTSTYANGAKEIEFDLLATAPSNVPARVTAINVWRNYRAVGASNYLDLWRLVERIDINDADWTVDTTNHIYTFTDQGDSTEDWESFTGLPDKSDGLGVYSDTLAINYQLCEMVNGYHFIADCYHPRIDQAQNFLFRSLRNRPDMYNWAEDFLVLPTKPVALANFLGKLYAFGEGVMYRIDPERMEIEQTIQGYGVRDKRSIVVTERGMLFCNSNNIYLHDGVQITPIGDPILHNDYDDTYSWLGANHTGIPLCLYDAKYDYFIVVYNRGGTPAWGAFVYHMKDQSWYIFDFDDTIGNGEPNGAFIAHSGEPIVSFSGIIVHVAGSTDRKAWKWVSKEINNGGENLVPYWAHIEGNCNNIKFVANNRPELEIDFTDSDYIYGGFEHRVYLNEEIPVSILGDGTKTSWGRWNKIRLELNGAASHVVNALSLQIRRVRSVTALLAPPEPLWPDYGTIWAQYTPGTIIEDPSNPGTPLRWEDASIYGHHLVPAGGTLSIGSINSRRAISTDTTTTEMRSATSFGGVASGKQHVFIVGHTTETAGDIFDMGWDDGFGSYRIQANTSNFQLYHAGTSIIPSPAVNLSTAGPFLIDYVKDDPSGDTDLYFNGTLVASGNVGGIIEGALQIGRWVTNNGPIARFALILGYTSDAGGNLPDAATIRTQISEYFNIGIA